MKWFLLLLLPFVLSGCASPQPELSPMQKRQITSRTIDGDYENVYRATMTVLQDQGYVIKDTDMMSGLIVAHIDRESSKGTQFMQLLLTGYIADQGTFIEISVTVNEINEDLQELRMNLQESSYNQYGGKFAIRQIYEPEPYNSLFNEIQVEVKRREALGR
jgi:hypothetical protein